MGLNRYAIVFLHNFTKINIAKTKEEFQENFEVVVIVPLL